MNDDSPKQDEPENTSFSQNELRKHLEKPDTLEQFLEEEFLAPLLKLSTQIREASLIKAKKTPPAIQKKEPPFNLIAPTISASKPKESAPEEVRESQKVENTAPAPPPSPLLKPSHTVSMEVQTVWPETSSTLIEKTTIPSTEEKTIVEAAPSAPKTPPAQKAKAEPSVTPLKKQDSKIEVKDSSEAEKRFLERQKKIEDLLKKDKGTTF